MTTPSIKIDGLSIGYDTKRNTRIVQRNLSACIMQGELTCLLGSNGIGKSTLLRTLSAFQPRIEGRIDILGKPIDSYNDKQLSQTIGVVLTEKPDVRNMTVRELSAEDYAIVDDSIEKVGISELSSRYIDTLSDGERQKVMIAKALAQQTPIIFLDEPTAFLDFPSKVEVMQLLRRLAREMEKTIFMSTHDLELALQVADTIWLMHKDGLNVGTAKELAAEGVLSQFVERSGIEFDREGLTVKVRKE